MSAATDAALQAVQGYKQLSSNDAMETANQKYDVLGNKTRFSNLQGLADNLAVTLDAVDPSVTARTTGNFTTEGQRAALVAKEQAPIASNLNKATQNASRAQSALQDSQTLASQMATALLNDDKQRYQQLLDVYNTSRQNDADIEAKRQYDEKMAFERAQLAASQRSSGRSGGGGGGGGSLSKGQMESIVRENLKPGKDGYISPGQWNSLLSDWNGAGGSTASFVSAFKSYANPWHYKSAANAKKYGSYAGIPVK